ncbi:MAG TPA: hypothetical protein VGH28_23470 [Polyangiaceae bacterium]|jgi:hypothetical protein
MKPATIEEQIRAIVRDELRAMLGPNIATYRSDGPLPPGVSRAWFAVLCKQLGVGRREGKVWIVAVDEWRTARAASKTPALRVVASDVERADAYLDAARARSTRGSR